MPSRRQSSSIYLRGKASLPPEKGAIESEGLRKRFIGKAREGFQECPKTVKKDCFGQPYTTHDIDNTLGTVQKDRCPKKETRCKGGGGQRHDAYF